MELERFQALRDYRTSKAFTERERAVLAFAEEATLNPKVSDGTFNALRAVADAEVALNLCRKRGQSISRTRRNKPLLLCG